MPREINIAEVKKYLKDNYAKVTIDGSTSMMPLHQTLNNEETMREVLLIAPNYKNKYLPMGLMKMSACYKQLGDNVRFFKSNIRHKTQSFMHKLQHNADRVMAFFRHSKLAYQF